MNDISIGQDDFCTLRQKNCLYVDKTAFVHELLSNKSPVLLLPRPRRFGKTLNMTMLHAFFDMTQDSRALFEGLSIIDDAEAMTHFNAHPTIFLSLKNSSGKTWPTTQTKLSLHLSDIVEKQLPLLNFERISPAKAALLKAIYAREAPTADWESCLSVLTEALYLSTGKKTILLIDEYDAPIHMSLEHGYFPDVVHFFREFLGAGLKGNPYLERAVLTGILRLAKESIFSGLNNLEVHTILDAPFSSCFGFTEAEVEALMAQAKSPHPMSEVRDWYNGYCFGKTTIYNPWSILNMLKRGEADLDAHWVNTSENTLIRQQIQKGGCHLNQLETLLRGGRIRASLTSKLTLRDISPDIAWSLFLFAGYLTAENYNASEQTADLYIPNFEVHRFFRDTVQGWLGSNDHGHLLIAALLEGKIDLFAIRLQETVVTILSYYDTAAKEPEKIFHVFILGLLAHLANRYRVVSNRETGHGRADLQLIPRQPGQAGFVFEFKVAAAPDAEALRAAASEALDQAVSRDYPATLRQEPINSLTTIGLANYGKRLALAYTEQTMPDGQPSERTYHLAGPEPENQPGQNPDHVGSKPKKPSAKARKKTKARTGAIAGGTETNQKIALIAQIQLLQELKGQTPTHKDLLINLDLTVLDILLKGLKP